MAEKQPAYEDVTVKLPRAIIDWLDDIAEDAISRSQTAEFFIRSEFHRFLIGAKLEELALEDVLIDGISSYLPVTDFDLKVALECINYMDF